MNTGFTRACLIAILLAAAGPAWALEPVGPESKAMLQTLREQKGEAPTAEELVVGLNQVTVGFLQAGQYAQAETVAREALALAERDLGPEHPETLAALNNLAGSLAEQGRYGEAEPLFARALEARERTLGRNHPDTLQSINNLALLYRAQGRYGEAEPLYLRALEARERTLGQDHPQTLGSLSNLAGLYKAQGRYDEAEPLYLRALESSERILGRNHPQTLTSLNNLATLYDSQGRYGEAEPLYLRALEARERVLGRDHPDTLGSLNNLALLYKSQGRYDEAEPLYVRTLKANERILGQDHPSTLTSLNNLAALYESQGRSGEAEPLYLRALEARERILGRNHPHTLGSVNNLAALYQDQGRYGKAEPLYLRALKSSERTLGRDHPQTLTGLSNLALLYRAQGRYGEAEPLYLRALKARERILGRDHPDTLISVSSLALLYHAQGRYGEAEPLLVRALESSERTLDQDHPNTLASVNNLAGLYESQGRSGEAEALYLRALKARERILGQDHPQTLTTQLNLALVLIANGQRERAVRKLRRMDQHLRRFVGDQLATTHRERIRRRWLLAKSDFQDAVFGLALGHPGPDTLRLAADVLLRWKRLAGEAEALTARLARTSEDPEVVKLAKSLSRHRAELSRQVNLPAPDPVSDQAAAVTDRKQAITDARAAVERLEVELAGRSREFQAQLASRTADWGRIRSELPRGSALLSLRAFAPVDFKTGDFGEPRWLGLVIPADPGEGPEILLEDLGPIAPTETMRKKLRDTNSRESAQALYRQLFGELDAELGKYDRLYIAADGQLDLVAFARLMVPDGRYWIQRQELRRIQTGRDLIKRDTDPAATTRGMIAYGGVDYAACPDEPEPSPEQPAMTGRSVGENRMLLAMNRRLRGEGRCFGPLKFSGPEVKAIGQFYWDPDDGKAQVWLGREASEARLKTRLEPLASPPRILHLATHGFFFERKSDHTERPMTLAGLALADANDGIQGKLGPAEEDGVLYAQEVLDLNLEGTELITLSACDTGKGEVDYSEGVYGLVRAFRIAGARNLLMTLWKLDDWLAARFMRDFYANWLQHPEPHPAAALRKTQLAWIRAENSRRSDPSYWAPYVLIE